MQRWRSAQIGKCCLYKYRQIDEEVYESMIGNDNRKAEMGAKVCLVKGIAQKRRTIGKMRAAHLSIRKPNGNLYDVTEFISLARVFYDTTPSHHSTPSIPLPPLPRLCHHNRASHHLSNAPTTFIACCFYTPSLIIIHSFLVRLFLPSTLTFLLISTSPYAS